MGHGSLGSVPSLQRRTSLTDWRRPRRSSVAWASRSAWPGLVRKLIVRLLVTARATGPMWESVTSHAAASASPIIVGPESVPPGRSWPASYGTRMRSPSAPACSTRYAAGRPGKAPARKSLSSSTVMARSVTGGEPTCRR